MSSQAFFVENLPATGPASITIHENSKYNIDNVNLDVKYDYAILFRNINITNEKMKEDMNTINRNFYQYINSTYMDRVAFIISSIKNLTGIVTTFDTCNFETIINYLESNLKIKKNDATCICLKNDKMDVLQLNDLIDHSVNYGKLNHRNIIALKINDLNVILFDAPIKI